MLWENVPGAFSSGDPKGEDFRIVLEETARVVDPACHVPRPAKGQWLGAGYLLQTVFSIAWRTVDAQFFGVPQRRRRIALVADFAGLCAPEVLFIDDGLPGYYPEGQSPGKPLPEALLRALEIQGNMASSGVPIELPQAFACNQRDEMRDSHDVSAALTAQPGMKAQTFVAAGFSAGAEASAGSTGYTEELAPTLKGTESGNCMPSVLCINDNGRRMMDCQREKTGTLRAQEHGHQPLVLFENHGVDGRCTGPHPVSPTLPTQMGTGGSNTPLVGTYGTASAAFRQKSPSDLVLNPAAEGLYIRRLMPIECERLQGFPDGWTALPGPPTPPGTGRWATASPCPALCSSFKIWPGARRGGSTYC